MIYYSALYRRAMALPDINIYKCYQSAASPERARFEIYAIIGALSIIPGPGGIKEDIKRSMINYWILCVRYNIFFIKSPIFLLFYHVSFAIYMTNAFNSKLVIQALDDYGV
jgi:hypothetical protein